MNRLLVFTMLVAIAGVEITIGADMRAEQESAASTTDVPDDQGYPAMRDAIVKHVTALLDELQRRTK